MKIQNVKLLNWQKIALKHFSDKRKSVHKDFVLVAGTGCGKTTAAVAMVSSEMVDDADALVLVACPSRSIKRGWKNTFKKFGIPSATRVNEVAPDRPVVITTYAGARQMLQTIHNYLNKRNLIIVFDEFHHLESNGEWAKPFVEMKESDYARRIFLSGTPWHESGDLELVEYVDVKTESGVEGRVVKADFRYTYGENVNSTDGDKNTVDIRFIPKSVTVDVGIYDKETGALLKTEKRISSKTCRSDPISDFVRFKGGDKGESLAILESARSTHIRSMIDEAVILLREQRKRLYKAGGIVFVSGKEEGLAVQEYLRKWHNINALFVMSDDPQAHGAIEYFDRGIDEWIIAIDMIAEGTDIPRLKVAVDLTNKMTMMSIIQRWGRIIRMLRDQYGNEDPNNIEAVLFHVEHAQLSYVAKMIEEEMSRFKKAPGEGGKPPEAKTFREVNKSEFEDKPNIHKGNVIDVDAGRLAQWLISTNYNGTGSMMDFRSAVWVAKSMIDDGRVPTGFYETERQERDERIPMTNDEEESHEDKFAKADKEHKFYIARIAEIYGGDFARATTQVNRVHGILKWDKSGKTLEQMEHRAAVAKQVLDHLTIENEDIFEGNDYE